MISEDLVVGTQTNLPANYGKLTEILAKWWHVFEYAPGQGGREKTLLGIRLLLTV